MSLGLASRIAPLAPLALDTAIAEPGVDKVSSNEEQLQSNHFTSSQAKAAGTAPRTQTAQRDTALAKDAERSDSSRTPTLRSVPPLPNAPGVPLGRVGRRRLFLPHRR